MAGKRKEFSLQSDYKYKERIKIWKRYATPNPVPTLCEKCNDTNAHRTVLLENGQHVCWYCWIKKDVDYGNVVEKPKITKTIITDDLSNSINNKLKVKKQTSVIKKIGNKIEVGGIKSTYARLNEQSTSDKFSLTRKQNILEKGICSYDPKAEYAIEMTDIHKSFLNGKIIANNDIDLRVRKNEIHAIIGENGAGKSTLMSILFGIYTQDRGIVKVNGKEVNFSSAKDATQSGLGMVYQHFQLVPTISVFKNIILGSEDASYVLGVIDEKLARQKLNGLIEKYQLNLNLDAKVSSLTVGQQQRTEILKLLYRDSDILIFDEPTAVLGPEEIEQFLKMLEDLKAEGKTIILINHKFSEIKAVADRATIIRLGTFISDFNVKEKSITEMAEDMIGKHVVDIKNSNHKFSDEVVLSVDNLHLRLNSNSSKIVNPINFKIHAGEVFAIAGVEGNGQTELVHAITGLSKKFKGDITLLGTNISHKSIHQRIRSGMSHIPENRHLHGLILDMPIYINTVSDKLDNKEFCQYGFMKDVMIREFARNLIKEFDVRGTTRGTSNARGLSGGNQQKLIIGRELTQGSKLVVMMQPTRGLDLGAINYIHQKVLDEKRKGNAILLVSYELDEILTLADTIGVMSGGSLIDVNDTTVMTRNHIGQLMAGKE